MAVSSKYFYKIGRYVINQQLMNYGIRYHSYNTIFESVFPEFDKLTTFERKPLYKGISFYKTIP